MSQPVPIWGNVNALFLPWDWNLPMMSNTDKNGFYFTQICHLQNIWHDISISLSPDSKTKGVEDFFDELIL